MAKIKTTGEIVSADDITASGSNLNGSSSSGAISLSEMASQYGGTAPHKQKDYYRNGTEGVPDTASTQNIPTSGAIGLKDFMVVLNQQ